MVLTNDQVKTKMIRMDAEELFNFVKENEHAAILLVENNILRRKTGYSTNFLLSELGEKHKGLAMHIVNSQKWQSIADIPTLTNIGKAHESAAMVILDNTFLRRKCAGEPITEMAKKHKKFALKIVKNADLFGALGPNRVSALKEIADSHQSCSKHTSKIKWLSQFEGDKLWNHVLQNQDDARLLIYIPELMNEIGMETKDILSELGSKHEAVAEAIFDHINDFKQISGKGKIDVLIKIGSSHESVAKRMVERMAENRAHRNKLALSEFGKAHETIATMIANNTDLLAACSGKPIVEMAQKYESFATSLLENGSEEIVFFLSGDAEKNVSSALLAIAKAHPESCAENIRENNSLWQQCSEDTREEINQILENPASRPGM